MSNVKEQAGQSNFPGVCRCSSPDISKITFNRWDPKASIRGLRHFSIGGMPPPPQLWHHCLNRPGLLLSTRHSFKKKEENRPLSNLQLDTYKCCGRTDGATLRRVCFRKVPAGSPIYHDYTRMNEVTWPAEIWWNWIWVVQWLCPCLPARLFKTLWKSSGHLFHPLTFSNNLLQS